MQTSTRRQPQSYQPSKDNLRSLLTIRSVALLGQTGVLMYVLLVSRTAQDISGLALSLVLFGVITAVSLWRCTLALPVTDQEFLAQLLVDVLGWTALMYFSGGANNPFISYYIVPLVVSAAVLPWRYTWLVTGSSLGAYSLLLYYYRPFPLFTPHAGMSHGNNIHILGMWFNFLFSAGLITYFVVRMASTLRRQEYDTAVQKEDNLRNEQILAVAGLAAGTAHELATPLSTIGVLLEELQQDDGLGEQARTDLDLIQSQLQQCRNILQSLSKTAQLSSIEQRQRFAFSAWANTAVEHWAVRRPKVVYSIESQQQPPSPHLDADLTLNQALENLLNNAADAGGEQIEIALSWNHSHAMITIRDHGSGMDLAQLESLGKPVIQTSESGLGLGLMLTHATIERYGGEIELHNTRDGGTIATLRLPIVVSGSIN